MRILQQCIYFPPEVGGLESHAYYLCKELVRLGNEVEMLTSRSRPGLPAHEIIDGIEVTRSWFPARNPIGWTLHTLASTPKYLTRASTADILHAQTFASAVPAIVAKERYGKPLVLTLHTSHFLRLAQRGAWRPVLRKIIAAADWVLAASEEIRDVALELYPHERAEALTNGVDTELFRPRAGHQRTRPDPRSTRTRLIVPRRLFHKNGVEYLIRALPLIREELEIEAVLVGDGPERERLEALARELEVDDCVIFLGAQPNEEMPRLYQEADLAVFPSLMEATSVAALEAMSCALPVAASRVGGLPEIVDGGNGTLFEPADPEDLAEKVITLLREADLDELGREARRRVVEKWSVERLARRHLEIYDTLLNGVR